MAVVGIDLGTTRSLIAHIADTGEPVVIANAESELLTPSIILLREEEGEIKGIVGKTAKMALTARPEDVATLVKRHMKEPEWIFVDSRGEEWRPETLSALILKKLKEDAEKELKEKITHAVITVPYYFGDLERKRTEQAGEVAELEVLGILDEPIAAVYAYALKEGLNPMTCCVYDFGGGTFDVSIVEVTQDQKIVVKTTAGNPKLGGEDLNAQIVRYFAEKFEEQNNIDPIKEKRTHYEFLQKAEGVKESLSDQNETYIALGAEGKTLSLTPTRKKLEELISTHIDMTIYSLEEALIYYRAKRLSKDEDVPQNKKEERRTKLVEELKKIWQEDKGKWKKIKEEEWGKIDKILLVGGSSRIPLVSQRIKEETGKEPEIADPDQAVVRGAAMQAAWLAKEAGIDGPQPKTITGEDTKSLALPGMTTTVVSHSLGVKAKDLTTGNFVNSKIIFKDAEIPEDGIAGREMYFTEANNQTTVEINLLQGEPEDPEGCEPIGSKEGILFDGIPPRPAGAIKIIIRMRYDRQNMVHVEAYALETEKKLEDITDEDLKGAPKLETKVEAKWLTEEQIEAQRSLVTKM